MTLRIFKPFETSGQSFQNVFVTAIMKVLSYEYTKKWCGVGSFTLTLPLTKRNVKTMQVGYIISVDGIAFSADWLMIETVDYSGGILTVSGPDLNGILNLRRTLFGAAQADGAQGYDIVEGSTAHCIEHYLNNNIISPADEERMIPNFSFHTNNIVGISNDSYMSRLELLSTVIEDLCNNANIGYRIYGNSAAHDLIYFRLLMGVDRSVYQTDRGKVVLAKGKGNVINYEFSHSVSDLYNAIYATGADVTMAVYRDSVKPSGFARRETAVDVGAVSVSEIRQYAIYEMRDNVESHCFDMDIRAGLYGEKFSLGDTITVYDTYSSNFFSAVVTEVKKTISNNQHSIKIVLGKQNQKLLNRIVTGIYTGTIKKR